MELFFVTHLYKLQRSCNTMTISPLLNELIDTRMIDTINNRIHVDFTSQFVDFCLSVKSTYTVHTGYGVQCSAQLID